MPTPQRPQEVKQLIEDWNEEEMDKEEYPSGWDSYNSLTDVNWFLHRDHCIAMGAEIGITAEELKEYFENRELVE